MPKKTISRSKPKDMDEEARSIKDWLRDGCKKWIRRGKPIRGLQ